MKVIFALSLLVVSGSVCIAMEKAHNVASPYINPETQDITFPDEGTINQRLRDKDLYRLAEKANIGKYFGGKTLSATFIVLSISQHLDAYMKNTNIYPVTMPLPLATTHKNAIIEAIFFDDPVVLKRLTECKID